MKINQTEPKLNAVFEKAEGLLFNEIPIPFTFNPHRKSDISEGTRSLFI